MPRSHRQVDADTYFDEGAGPVVRPYALIGGRTRGSGEDLDLLAMLSATSPTSGRRVEWLSPEQRAIVELCSDRMSVAEVSAHLDLPLGVVRVLVGDLLDHGLLVVHRPVALQSAPDLALLETVIDGLRKVT